MNAFRYDADIRTTRQNNTTNTIFFLGGVGIRLDLLSFEVQSKSRYSHLRFDPQEHYVHMRIIANLFLIHLTESLDFISTIYIAICSCLCKLQSKSFSRKTDSNSSEKKKKKKKRIKSRY